jgi:hypothetical protein
MCGWEGGSGFALGAPSMAEAAVGLFTRLFFRHPPPTGTFLRVPPLVQ